MVDPNPASPSPDSPDPLALAQQTALAEEQVKNPATFDAVNVQELLADFVLIYGTETCYDTKGRRVLKVAHLSLARGARNVRMWLAHPDRRMVLPEELVFDPGGSPESPRINLFEGFPLDPAPGDVSPLMELLAYLCADSAGSDLAVEAVIDWTLKWLALPLQRPVTKMRTALVFHGPEGAGKNLFFETVAAIYGKYALVVGQSQLESQFNDWASQKLFLIGDEVVARQDMFHQKNTLKAFITGKSRKKPFRARSTRRLTKGKRKWGKPFPRSTTSPPTARIAASPCAPPRRKKDSSRTRNSPRGLTGDR